MAFALKKKTPSRTIQSPRRRWSEWRDLNPRPHGPEPCAIPNFATPRLTCNCYFTIGAHLPSSPILRKCPGKRKSAACGAFLERIMGIEPTYPAWEAGVLPMNYIRITLCSIAQREGKCKSIFRRSGISFPHASLPCRIPRLGLGIGLLQPGFQRILG